MIYLIYPQHTNEFPNILHHKKHILQEALDQKTLIIHKIILDLK